MELFAFARFHVKAGNEMVFEEAVREVLLASRAEEGCVEIHAYRSTRDRQLFYIHSRWKDEEAFDKHANLPHTVKYLRTVETLIDRPPEFTRTERIA